MLRVLINALFASEFWGRDIELFSNSLFWSLSYEAGFYLLYWIFRSTGGAWRYALSLCGCALVGPNIVVMLVPWLGGVLIHDLTVRLRPRTARPSLATGSVRRSGS